MSLSSPGHHAAARRAPAPRPAVVTHDPKDPGHYKQILRRFADLAHVTVEVNRCTTGRHPGGVPVTGHPV